MTMKGSTPMSETLTLAGIASCDLAGLNASVTEGLIDPIVIDGDRLAFTQFDVLEAPC